MTWSARRSRMPPARPVKVRPAPRPRPRAAAAVREGNAPGVRAVRLHYKTRGDGPALLCSNGIGVSTFFWEPLAEALSDAYRVVQWDYRGHGKSDRLREPADISIETCADDLAAVMDALKIDRAVLLGHSMGSQVGFEFYRKYPGRVLALVPTLGTYRRAIETFFDRPEAVTVFEAARALGTAFPEAILRLITPLFKSGAGDRIARALGIVHPTLCPHDLLVPYFEHMTTIDLRSYFTLATDMQRHDATQVLPQIRVPTLIVAGDRDRFCPLRLAHEMKSLIPGAEMFVIRDGTHAALVEQPDLLHLRVRRFLEQRVFARSRGRVRRA